MGTEKLSKIELVPLLVEAAISLAENAGVEERLGGLPGKVLVFDRDPLSIIFRAPKSMATIYGSSNYGIDVWFDRKKVFSVCWNTQLLKDFEVVNFKRGPWVHMLLAPTTSQMS